MSDGSLLGEMMSYVNDRCDVIESNQRRIAQAIKALMIPTGSGFRGPLNPFNEALKGLDEVAGSYDARCDAIRAKVQEEETNP